MDIWYLQYGAIGKWNSIELLFTCTNRNIRREDVSTFWDTTVYVKSDGSVWGMGRNHHKMISNGSSSDYLSPVKIVESGVAKAAVGYWHLIYLKNDGSVWGRGSNAHGRLGQPSGTLYSDPVQIAPSGAVDVGVGSEHSMILMEDGKILTFGRNNFGQLGTGEALFHQIRKTCLI